MNALLLYIQFFLSNVVSTSLINISNFLVIACSSSSDASLFSSIFPPTNITTGLNQG